MAAGNCVLVNDQPLNVETVGDAGVYFSGQAGAEDLYRKRQWLLADPTLVDAYRERALNRAHDYSRETITDQYERVLTDVFTASGHGPLPVSLLDLEPSPNAGRGCSSPVVKAAQSALAQNAAGSV